MKKTISLIIALAVIVTAGLIGGTAAAADATTAPDVRVNTIKVAFPDAQPYVDNNSRTLIPVRFVTEALGADVSWNGKAAVIVQDGITVTVPIGSSNITVEQNGTTRTVTMDTAAVIKEQRTFVPIRFVAEALGAYVDFSNAYNTVQIYNDGKSVGIDAPAITLLRKIQYTASAKNLRGGYTVTKESGEYSEKNLQIKYGKNRESFQDPQYGFANSAEHWLRPKGAGTDTFATTRQEIAWNNGRSALAAAMVNEATAKLTQKYVEYEVSFASSTALLYQGEGSDLGNAVVRGILTVKANEDFSTNLTEITMKEYDFGNLKKGDVVYYIVDAHMVCYSTGAWHVDEVINICEAPEELR